MVSLRGEANGEVTVFFLGLCPSCNRYINNKPLRFVNRLSFRLQASITLHTMDNIQ